MEKADVGRGASDRPGSARRLAVRAAALGVLAAALGLIAKGPGEAVAALAGCAAAALYAASYLRSHLERTPSGPFDARLAGRAIVRMVLVAVAALGSLLAGRAALIAFVAAFGLAFAALAGAEIPRAVRYVRGRGLSGS